MTLVDIRPHRYLREIRDHGNLDLAAEKAGLTNIEINELLTSPKYYRAVIECARERIEEQLIMERDEKVIQILNTYNTRIIRLKASTDVLLRGPDAMEKP